MTTLQKITRLMRYNTWGKNLIIFIPFLLYGTPMGFFRHFGLAMSVFFAFSVAASIVYIFNDFMDLNEDRAHPKKKRRVLAAGIISEELAVKTLAVLVSIEVLLLCFVPSLCMEIILLYFSLNILYSTLLKNKPPVDIICIALGYVFRIGIGYALFNTPADWWFCAFVFCLALFLTLVLRVMDAKINKTYTPNNVFYLYNAKFLAWTFAIASLFSYLCFVEQYDVLLKVSTLAVLIVLGRGLYLISLKKVPMDLLNWGLKHDKIMRYGMGIYLAFLFFFSIGNN
ncbi:MAG: UbiA family prenyltransferase [Alphaproteobacteria bacterium]|nr:UbiA family prenyltransferase [Alphaproteobacteria bacterium]